MPGVPQWIPVLPSLSTASSIRREPGWEGGGRWPEGEKPHAPPHKAAQVFPGLFRLPQSPVSPEVRVCAGHQFQKTGGGDRLARTPSHTGQRGRSPSIPNTQLSVREVAVSFAVEGAETFSPLSCHPQGECQLGRPSRQQEGDSEVRLVKGTPKRGVQLQPSGWPGKENVIPSVLICEIGQRVYAWGSLLGRTRP